MNAQEPSRTSWLYFLTLIALLALPLTSTAGKPHIQVSIGGNTLTFSADAALYVRVGGPGDYFKQIRGEGHLQWTPDYGMPDGTYRYDCYATTGESSEISPNTEDREETARRSSSRVHGVFLIKNGMLVEKETGAPDRRALLQPVGESGLGHLLREAVGAVLDVLVPPAHALHTIDDDLQVSGYVHIIGSTLVIDGDIPVIDFFDTDLADYNWRINADGSSFFIHDIAGTNNAVPLLIENTTSSSAIDNAIRVGADGLGDISFANWTMYIDQSEGAVGIGTLVPQGSLHIVDAQSPELILEDTFSGATRWELEATNNGIQIYGNNALSGTAYTPFYINNNTKTNTLVLGNTGIHSQNVGMGTNTPDTGLHIRRGDGNGIIKVQETSDVNARRYQIHLENNGATGFFLHDTSTNRSWRNAMNQAGDFVFAQGTNGPKLLLKTTGLITMGLGRSANLLLQPGGDLEIPNGAVTATAFQQSSSRSAKQGFSAVDEAEVLDKLLALEISEWEYKDPSVAGRHLGPVAEEFHELFGFGTSDKHIYPADMASIGLVAARQLQRDAKQRDAEIMALKEENTKIATLERENTSLKDRVARLEQLVVQLSHD